MTRLHIFYWPRQLNTHDCADWFAASSPAAEFLFLLWAVYLCYAVRTVPSAFHEPRYMAIAVHNELILSAIFYVIRYCSGCSESVSPSIASLQIKCSKEKPLRSYVEGVQGVGDGGLTNGFLSVWQAAQNQKHQPLSCSATLWPCY